MYFPTISVDFPSFYWTRILILGPKNYRILKNGSGGGCRKDRINLIYKNVNTLDDWQTRSYN